MSTLDTAIGVTAYVTALMLTAAASVLLAGFIALRARQMLGGPLLAVFLMGVATWSIAQVLPALFGPSASAPVTILIALSPLPAAAFVHLVFAYAQCGALRPVTIVSYALAAFATLVGLLLGVGQVVAWRGFPGMFVPSPVGWGVLGTAASLSVAGHLRLARAWRLQRGAQSRQAGAVFASSAIGLFALTGFAFPALGIDAYPWPVLALPLYSVALVYGILRHRFMAVSLWARRALLWLMLIVVAGSVAAGIAGLPLALLGRPAGWLATWAATTLTLAFGILLLAPLKRLADAIVFPGGRLSDSDIEAWRDALGGATGHAELERIAATLLARRTGIAPGPDAPGLRVVDDRVVLDGWSDAPAATRHLAERFAALVAEAARRLTASRLLVEAERERQQSARLAELGELAATVAHDLRNPLGIVTMAATAAPPEVRREIGEQVARMDHLVTDILDYARAWQVDPQPLALSDLIGPHGVAIAGDTDLLLTIDRRAMRRVFANLIDNARALGANVAIHAQAGPSPVIDICDDGPGIAPEIADSLFRPFVSRRPGGTGLGLAIARRIVEAHGGTLTLAQRAGWSTCFRITLGVQT